MHRSLFSMLVTAFFVLVSAPTPGYAVTITVGSTTASAGDMFSIPISISGVTNLTSFQFNLSFDQTSVMALAVNEGTDFADAATASGGFTLFGPGAIDNTTGLVSLVTDVMVGSLGPGLAPGGVLVTIDFEALASGVLPFTLTDAFLTENDVALSSANGDFDLQAGQVAVPEPSTLVLLGLGLGAFGMQRLRKRHS